MMFATKVFVWPAVFVSGISGLSLVKPPSVADVSLDVGVAPAPRNGPISLITGGHGAGAAKAAAPGGVAWNDRGLAPNENDATVLAPDAGLTYTNWSLCNVRYDSNLCGLGPERGEQSIRYFGVATAGNGQAIDLVVTANSSYAANDFTRNGLVKSDSCFGVINLLRGTTVDVLFSWYLSGTNTSVALENFFFTVYDLDTSKKAVELATFYQTVSDLYYVPDAELNVTGSLSSGLGLEFRATEFGVGPDNPTDPMNLTEAQKRRAVMVGFENKTQWKVTFTVEGGGSGRNFVFAGMANLAPATPTPSPTPTPTPSPTTCTDAGTCSVYEDPHIKVFDGARISLLQTETTTLAAYGSCDMWLVRSGDVSIQARYSPDPNLPEDKLFVRAAAIGVSFLAGNTLIVGPLNGNITWNGRAILESQNSDFTSVVGSGVVRARRSKSSHLVEDMTQTNPGVDIELPHGLKVTVNRLLHHVNLFIEMPPAEGGQDGLCGNFNCNRFDDSLQMILSSRHPNVRPGESLFSDEVSRVTFERKV